MKTLIEYLQHWCKHDPNKVAIIHNGDRITYQEFLSQVLRLAEQFSQLGWRGKRIIVALPNCPALATIYYAAFHAGVVIVPINVTFKAEQIKKIVETTTPHAAIIHSSILNEISLADLPINNHYIIDDKSSGIAINLTNPSISKEKFAQFEQSELSMIFSTSGSTGNPKFIMHSNHSLLAMAKSMANACSLTAADKFLISESMSNASGTTHLTLTLTHGATAILVEELAMLTFKKVLNDDGPTIICIMGKGNLDIIHSPILSKEDFKSTRFNFTGGDKITKELINQFKQKTGIALRVGYGMSECLLIAINASHDANKQGSVGTVTLDLLLEIRDNVGKPVKPEEVGEICVKGENVMLGYWQNSEATAQALVKGWLHTGDLAYQDKDGYLWIVGHLKNIIIRDGENVSPYEIEEMLATHPAVKIAGVIGIPDAEEGQVPYAFIELKALCQIEEIELFLKTKLNNLSLPKYIKVIGSMPRTPTGKIDREKLKTHM